MLVRDEKRARQTGATIGSILIGGASPARFEVCDVSIIMIEMARSVGRSGRERRSDGASPERARDTCFLSMFEVVIRPS